MRNSFLKWVVVGVAMMLMAGMSASLVFWRNAAQQARKDHENCQKQLNEEVERVEEHVRECKELHEMIAVLHRQLAEANAIAERIEPAQAPGEIFRAMKDQLLACRGALEARDKLIEALESDRKLMQADIAKLKAADEKAKMEIEGGSIEAQ